MIFYLALGSNQGDRLYNLRSAISCLSSFATLLSVSSIYETKAKYEEDQSNFYNMVCTFSSNLKLHDFFKKSKNIEKELGRITTYKNGPRIIDIDILFTDSITYRDAELEVPHPRISERAFVLVPLAEIGALVNIPTLTSTPEKLLKALPESLLEEVKLIRDKDLLQKDLEGSVK